MEWDQADFVKLSHSTRIVLAFFETPLGSMGRPVCQPESLVQKTMVMQCDRRPEGASGNGPFFPHKHNVALHVRRYPGPV